MSEDIPHYGQMNEQRAREILGIPPLAEGRAALDGANNVDYLKTWGPGESVTLDGHFTADQLEAIAWWMRNKAAP